MMNMKSRLFIYTLSIPFAVIAFLFDCIKLPILCFAMPFFAGIWLIELLKGEDDSLDPIELFCDASTIGYQMWLDLVKIKKQ